MTRREAFEVMVGAATALTDEEKENLRWHLRRGTKILCRNMAFHYADGKGGG